MSKGTNSAILTDNGYPSEEMYKILFEQATEGIFVADESGQLIEVNPCGCEMFGYLREEILQLSVQELISMQDPEQFFIQLKELQAGNNLIAERSIRRKNGTYTLVEVNAKMLSDGIVLGLLRDISERERAKQESLQLARFPSEDPSPVMRVSNQGKILYANKASKPLLEDWNTKVGGMLPSGWKKTTSRLAEKRSDQTMEVTSKGRIYTITITPVPGTDYVNLYGSDITEIKHSQEALRRAEEKYRNIFEHSPDGIFQSTPDGRFITVNPALARIWGYDSPEEVIEGITNIAHQIYVNSKQREEFLRLMDENREVQDFEFQAYRKDGSVIWVQENVRAVRDADGNVQYYEGTVKDITEQKQTVAALRHSEERYRSTLNNMMEGCQIIDFDWRYIYVNDAAARHGRYKPEEMLMHTMMELYPGVEKTELFAVLQRCMEQRTEHRMENQFAFPDGNQGWFELSIQPVPEGLFILSIDISERKRAEIDLKDREARYRTLFENLPIPVFTKDRKGRYTSCNAEELQYWVKNPIGHIDEELLPPEIARDLRQADLQVMETGEPIFREEKFQSPTGVRYALTRKVPLHDGSGSVIGVLGAGVDITDRKQAEKKLLESEERYRDLVDNSQELICTHDLEGKVLSVNPWAAKTLGYKLGVLLGKNIVDFLTPDSKAGFQAYLNEVQRTGRAQGRMTVLTRSGEQLIWEYNNSLRTEGVDQPIVRGMAHDVTEQRKAEKKVKQQLARLTALREIDQFITSSFDLNQTLASLVQHVTRQLDLDAASILLFNSGSNVLEYAAGEGFVGNSTKNLRLKVGENYAGKIALERKMVRISDITKANPPFNQANFIEEENFVAYFGLPLIAKGQIKGVMEAFHRSHLDPDEEWLSYLETLAGQAAIAIDNALLFKNLQRTNTELTQAYDATIEGWSYALDLRDKETEGHTQRVTEITFKLCEKFGLSEKELTNARWGALLHDIGKMGIPDAILLKPGKLTDEEWVIMKMHPVFARKMLERVNYLKSAIDIPYYHHEKWDGSGYPEGLQGKQIPLTARIFAIADVWDALTSDRPYRPAWSKKDALNYIKSANGTHLDPEVVKVFIQAKELWDKPEE